MLRLESQSLKGTDIAHGFFGRTGGVSTGLYASLNCGPGSQDAPEAVSENRRRVLSGLAKGGEARLVTLYQIHSAEAVSVEAPWQPSDNPKADGMATDRAGIALGILAADCAPVLLADPAAAVVAAVHAGWRGALAGVVEAGIAAMVSLGADPARISAAIGPCIGPASYEVGLEFEAGFTAADGRNARFFRPGARPDKRLFDLPGFVLARLAAAGVLRAEWIGRDTFAEADLFFSNRRAAHRRERECGRLLSAITPAP